MQRIHKWRVELQQRLPAGAHDEASPVAVQPRGRDGRCEIFRRREFPAAWSIGADEIGIAECADGVGAILLAAGPQVATGESQEHRRASGIRALALQRVVDLLHRVRHAPRTPAASKPLRRSWHASQRPHGSPDGEGS